MNFSETKESEVPKDLRVPTFGNDADCGGLSTVHLVAIAGACFLALPFRFPNPSYPAPTSPSKTSAVLRRSAVDGQLYIAKLAAFIPNIG